MSEAGGGGRGVGACEAAFQRLVDGAPIVPEHVGLDPSKITAGIVSVEAGFDRGYLKKARKSHQSLIARIEAYRADVVSRNSIRSPSLQLKKLAQHKLTVEADLKVVSEQRDAVLALNLQLYERIRELEIELARLLPKIS